MKNKLKYLVLHCTATPEGRAIFGSDIRRMHLSPPPVGRGWKQVGYTDLIQISGKIERLVKNNEDAFVDGWEITNGATGINSVSRHVVYAGGVDSRLVPKDTRNIAQKLAMEEYVKNVIKQHPDILVAGHNQFANKRCPSFDVPRWLREIGVAEKNIYKP